MQLVPAPMRQFQTASMCLLIAAGIFDLAVVLVQSLSDAHAISSQTLALINAGLAFATGAVRMVRQQIASTTSEKVELIAAAAAQPVHPGQLDVVASIVPVVGLGAVPLTLEESRQRAAAGG